MIRFHLTSFPHARTQSSAPPSFTAFKWIGVENLLSFSYSQTSVYVSKGIFACVIVVSTSSGEDISLLTLAFTSVRPCLVSWKGNINRPQMILSLRSRTAGSDDVPIAAELYSGTFVIYSTKE